MLKMLNNCKHFKKGSLIFLLFILLSINVLAHAKLEKSSPATDEVLTQTPKTVELLFSVAMQSSGINSIIVTDQTDKRVDKNNLVVSDDGKKLTAELNDLKSGVYKVVWRAISNDDHTIKGEYNFSVKLNKNVSVADNKDKPQSPQTVKEEVKEDHSQHTTQESGTSWLQSIVSWFLYLAMFLLFGGFAFRLFVLKPTLKQLSTVDNKERQKGLDKSGQRFLLLLWLSLAALLLIIPARLLLQTSSVFGISFTDAFSISKLSQVLTQTGFGFPWILQLVLMILLFIAVLLYSRSKESKKPFLWAGLIFGAFLFLTPSLSGHSRAANQEYSFAIISDWIHLIAGGVWVGGLFHLLLTAPKAFEDFPDPQRLSGTYRVIPLFSRLAIGSTLLIILTGIYNSWIHLASISALFNTTYGITLLIKILLVLPMLALGGLNSFILHPQMKKTLAQRNVAQEKYQAIRKKFYRSVSFEIFLGILVLLVVSILTFLPPGK